MGEKKQALNYKRGNLFFVPPEEIFVPGVDDGGEEHYLKDIDPVRHGIAEKTVLNIMAEGIHQPINVTREGDRVTVVAGRRRVLHARAASQRLTKSGREPLLVPCVVRRGDEAALYGIYISENEHRMNNGPVSKARQAEKLRNYGYPTGDIAIKFGVENQTIENWARLLELEPRVLQFVENGQLGMTAALKLHDKPYAEQHALAAEAVKEAGNGKRVSQKALTKKADPDALHAPGKRVVQKLLEERPTIVTEDFLAGVAWARGMEPNAKVEVWVAEQKEKQFPPKKETKDGRPAKRRSRKAEVKA